MNVFLDVHAANNAQQSAVARHIASSHKDLHAVASIPSRSDQFSQKCCSMHCIPRNKSLLGILINNHGSFSSINSSNNFRLLGCKMFHPPILNMDRFHHTLRINSGIRHDVLNQFFIHHDFLVTFQVFQLLSSIRSFGLILQIFLSRALRHVQFSIHSFNSLLLISPASSPRYHTSTSPM